LPLRRSFRELRRRPARNFLVIITIGIAFALLLSSTMLDKSMQITLDNQRKLTSYSDIQIITNGTIPNNLVTNISSVSNVDIVELRTIVTANITLGSQSQIVSILGVPSPQQPLVDPVSLDSGTYFSSADELNVIQSSSWNGKLNSFTLYTSNSSLLVHVIGTGSSPDLQETNSLIMPTQTILRLFPSENITSIILIRLNNPDQAVQTANTINQLFNSSNISNVNIRFTQRSYFWESFQAFFTHYIFIIGIVGLVLGAIIVYASSKLKVERETYEIGVFKAVGATKKDLLIMFLSDGFVMSICAILIGFLIGYFFLSVLVYFVSSAAHLATFATTTVDPITILELSGLTIALTVFAVFSSSYSAITSSPQSTLQKRYGTKISSRASKNNGFRVRFIRRNLQRAKSRYIAVGLIILLSTSAAFAMVSTLSATQKALDTFGNGLPDIYVHNYSPTNITGTVRLLESNGDIQAAEPLANGMIFLNEGLAAGIQGIALDSSVQNMSSLLKDGRTIRSNDEVVISSFLSSKITKSVGDNLTFSVNEVSVKTFSLRIVGVVYFPSPEIYASFSFVQSSVLSLNNLNSQNSVDYIVKVKDNVSINDALHSLTQKHLNSYIVSARSELGLETSQYVLPLDILNYSIIFLMIILSALSVFTMIAVGLLERRREYSILKVVGVTPRGVIGSIILEILLVTLPFAILGIPLGFLLANISLQAAQMLMSVPFTAWFSPGIQVVIITFLLEIGCALLGSLPSLGLAWQKANSDLRYE
jgi:ABC-type antimicrobial peptide transport system permease subunit